MNTPARLRRAAAIVVVGAIVAALVSLAAGLNRSAAADDAGGSQTALSADAAELYRLLAEADAMVTSGYVAGGREPVAIRNRYDLSIEQATERLAQAGRRVADDDPAAGPLATIGAELPVYVGLMETARTYNRQGLPLGQSYLSSGAELMRFVILPAAAELRLLANDDLETALAGAEAPPFAFFALASGLLIAIADLAWQERARTNRTVSPGLLVAGVAVIVAAGWWVTAWALATGAVDDARRHSSAVALLDDAHATVLQARSTENLVLVARSGGDAGFQEPIRTVVGDDGYLARAAALGADTSEVDDAIEAWIEAHAELRNLDDDGRYTEAVASSLGDAPGDSGAAFTRLDQALTELGVAGRELRAGSIAQLDRSQFLLPVGPALLLIGAAVAVARGIGRRVAEYR